MPFSEQLEELSFGHEVQAAYLDVVTPVIESDVTDEGTVLRLLEILEVLGHTKRDEGSRVPVLGHPSLEMLASISDQGQVGERTILDQEMRFTVPLTIRAEGR